MAHVLVDKRLRLAISKFAPQEGLASNALLETSKPGSLVTLKRKGPCATKCKQQVNPKRTPRRKIASNAM